MTYIVQFGVIFIVSLLIEHLSFLFILAKFTKQATIISILCVPIVISFFLQKIIEFDKC